MLLAVCDVRGPTVARGTVLTAMPGPPEVMVEGGQGAVGVWGQWAGGAVDQGWALEGWMSALPTGAPDPRALPQGCFAFAALRGTELWVASGGAGGYRPVYVRIETGRAIASTSLRALLSLLEGKPELDWEYLADRISLSTRFGFAARQSTSATPYRGILRLPMFEAWALRPGDGPRRTSTLRDVGEDEARGTADDHVALVRTEFQDAVARSTRGARRVAVMVSGGIDSSAVLAVASRLVAGTGETLPFSWDYATPAGDDRPYLRTLAGYLGMEPVRIGPHEASPRVIDSMVLDGMPGCAPPAALSLELLRRTRESSADVVLDGSAGDAVMDGEPRILADLALRGHPVRAVRIALTMRGPHGIGRARRLRDYVLVPLAEPWTPRGLLRRRWRRQAAHAYPWARGLLRRRLEELVAMPRTERIRLGSSPAERFRTMVGQPWIDESLLLRASLGVAAGVELRDPFGDEAFLRALATIPPASFFHGGYLRGLFRNAMKGVLPDEVRLRETKAWMEPGLLDVVVGAGGFGVFDELAKARRLGDAGLVEPSVFRRAFEDWARRPLERTWPRIWSALSVEAFLQRYAGRWPP
jgi:asparagine synthase (glutamine-hydrolysing)